jgi:hypothetical protein
MIGVMWRSIGESVERNGSDIISGNEGYATCACGGYNGILIADCGEELLFREILYSSVSKRVLMKVRIKE